MGDRERDGRKKWAKIWFASLARFHRIDDPGNWTFTDQDVIAFLRSCLASGMPTRKRLRIVESLIIYRDQIRCSAQPRLEPIRVKLRERLRKENERQANVKIDDVVGKIDAAEPEIIQALRRTMRRNGLKFSTEKAYVKQVRRFIAGRAISSFADFGRVTPSDVENFLTDLAVDGNVASRTQNQAFYAMKFLFEQVFMRDLGEMNPARSSKEARLPSVMSKPEVRGVLAELAGMYQLIAELLYGCGMRISECLRLQSGTDIREIQELLGHADLNTTMIYTYVLTRTDIQVVSPLDCLSVDSRESANVQPTAGRFSSLSDSPNSLRDEAPRQAGMASATKRSHNGGASVAVLPDRSRHPSSPTGILNHLRRWCFGAIVFFGFHLGGA